ncbi:MAG: hypothetical protein IKB07_11260 [Lachnospiraceae bacterium]|nr:hypothetical protein [Lachnospiraceae bacterium]
MGNEKRYTGIGKVAWGYLFVYFNLKINSVSLLPAFVGYLLFLSAIGDLREDERELELLKPLGIILAVWHGLNWLGSFWNAGLGGKWQVVDILIGMINLYFHFQLLTNLASVARRYQSERQVFDKKLLGYRTVQTVILTALIVIGHFFEWIGNFGTVVSALAVLVYLVLGIALMRVLFAFRRCLREDRQGTEYL